MSSHSPHENCSSNVAPELLPDVGSTMCPDAPVCITWAQYDALLQAAQHLELLKNALKRGGITPDTLSVLIDGEAREQRKDSAVALEDRAEGKDHDGSTTHDILSASATPFQTSYNPWDTSDPTSKTQAHEHPVGGNGDFGLRVPCTQRLRSASQALSHQRSGYFDLDRQDVSDGSDAAHATQQPKTLSRHDKRTLLFTSLSDSITHKDLTSVIRGGRILDIHIATDKTARVSMCEGAADFLHWVKRNDLYVKTKRLDVRWNDRQFVLNPHISNKIEGGASRNFVIRNAANAINEDELRHHMEHIHNLVVIDVTYSANDVHVSTNSIHNALFARTCMMSRMPYKRFKITYLPDECAQPLPVAARTMATRSANAPALQKQPAVTTDTRFGLLQPMNRFDLLTLEDGSDEENYPPGRRDDDKDDIDSNGLESTFSDLE